MAGIKLFEEQLRLMTPHTYNALQKLVLSMAKVAKNAEKKTIFGRDKGEEAYSKFLSTLKTTLHSMVLDDVIREATPTEQVMSELEEKMNHFKMAFPNWPDAYEFWRIFFEENKKDALATIDRLRSQP